MLKNWKSINSNTHQVFEYIEQNIYDLTENQQLCMLTMHTIVDITDKPSPFFSACLILTASDWCQSAIKCANQDR